MQRLGSTLRPLDYHIPEQEQDKGIKWFLPETLTIKESEIQLAQQHTWPRPTNRGSNKCYLAFP